MVGKVKWFDQARGYGFINRLNDNVDIFVHFSQIREDGFKVLDENQAVEFEIHETERGLQARNVIKI